MRLDEEAKQAEESIVGSARRIKDVATLKEILRDSLVTFENALDALSTPEKEEALSLYLDKIRKVTFGFHSVILRRTARKQFVNNPSRGAMHTIVDRHGENMQDIARLYKFL